MQQKISLQQKITYILFGLTIILLLITFISPELLGIKIDPEDIKELILSAGSYSWLAYLVLIIVSVLSPIPSSIFALVGGYIFNPLLIIFLNFLGEALGASGNFYIGRLLGKKIVTKRFPKIKKTVDKITMNTIFLLALIPVGTSNITGYSAGVSEISYKKYISGWMSGIMLLNTVITLLGYSAQQQSLLMTGIISALGIVAIFAVHTLMKNHTKKSKK